MGWISWFCPGLNFKRWLLLFAAGVLLCSLALALLFNYQVMGFAEELLFRMSYQATGKYSNGYAVGAGIVVMLIGLAHSSLPAPH